jgi:hypothetical protein
MDGAVLSGEPDPKSRSLARGARRYRRKVASPKQWQAIIAAKRGPCRVYGEFGRFVLVKPCLACNREAGTMACLLCAKWEIAERDSTGEKSSQLADQLVEYHHLVSRAQGGDDVEDNIVPLSLAGHRRITEREPDALAAVAASLTWQERDYCVHKLGPGALQRLFGVNRG